MMSSPAHEMPAHERDTGAAPPRPPGPAVSFTGPRQIWPLALLLLIAFAVVGGALWVGGSREDHNELRVERRIVVAQRDELLDSLRRVVIDYSWWNEAFRKVEAGDVAWLDRNFGEFLFRVHDLDIAAIRSPSGKLVYASREGVRVDEDPSLRLGAALDGVLAGLKGNSMVGPMPVVTMLRGGSDIYAVAASPILLEEDAPEGLTAKEAGHLVLARRIGDWLLGRLAHDYGILAPVLADHPIPGKESVALDGPDGAPVAFIDWQASHPGARLQRWLMVALPVVLALLALLSWVGFRNVQAAIAASLEREDMLRQLAEEQRLQRFRNEFVSMVSHELRSPLTSVIGHSALISHADLPQTTRRQGRLIRQAGEAMLQIVNDLLDLAKLDSGHLELESIPFDLRELVAGCGQMLGPQADAKGVALGLPPPETLPERVVGDPGRLRQVLLNLLGNGLKFTDEGSVVLEMKLEPEGESAILRAAVTDTGRGVPPDRLKAIFEPFSQADVSIARRYGGTGLGLSICRRLVELMGGTIGARSEEGRGSTFFFTVRLGLPIAARAEEQVHA
jgi:signal transduction histidine kinase